MRRTWPKGGWPKMGLPVDAMVPVSELEEWADPSIDLEEYARDEEYMAQLRADIEARGVINPIVVKVGRGWEPFIEGGHHRLLAAKQLGIAELPVFWKRDGPPGWEYQPKVKANPKLKRRLMR